MTVSNNFSYPGHSNAITHNNYAFYAISKSNSFTRSEISPLPIRLHGNVSVVRGG